MLSMKDPSMNDARVRFFFILYKLLGSIVENKYLVNGKIEISVKFYLAVG